MRSTLTGTPFGCSSSSDLLPVSMTAGHTLVHSAPQANPTCRRPTLSASPCSRVLVRLSCSATESTTRRYRCAFRARFSLLIRRHLLRGTRYLPTFGAKLHIGSRPDIIAALKGVILHKLIFSLFLLALSTTLFPHSSSI